MKPPRTDQDRFITEQCWVGIACLLFWAVVIMGMTRCSGAELPPPVATIFVKWTQAAPAFIEDEVIQWKIYRTHPLPRVQVAVSEVPHAWITVADGERFVVTSCTSTEESRDSAEWTARLPYPDPLVRVTVQTSTDNKTFTDHQAFEFRLSNAEFYRFKIEPQP